jgi:hypothetical protein
MINFDKEDMKHMWGDIAKFLTIAIIIHLMLYIVDDYGELFGEFSLKIFLYLTIGLIIYYLIIKNILNKYVFDEEEEEGDKKNEKRVKRKRRNRKIKYDGFVPEK